MHCTLSINYEHGTSELRQFDTVTAATTYFDEQLRELDRFGGLYLTAASNGEEANVTGWFARGHEDDEISYPDEVWEVRPRRTVDRWSGAWWTVQRTKA